MLWSVPSSIFTKPTSRIGRDMAKKKPKKKTRRAVKKKPVKRQSDAGYPFEAVNSVFKPRPDWSDL